MLHFAWSDREMTPDPYRTAYEKALADLSFIAERYEWLNTRKRHVENLISALQPALDPGTQSAPENSTSTVTAFPTSPQEITAETAEPASEAEEKYSFLDVPAPLPESDGDPFERRVKASFRFRGLSAQRSF
jgi:hypothetical protein